MDKLNENNQQITTGNAVSTKIWDALRLDWCRQLGQELKTSMLKTFVAHIATFKAVVDGTGGFPRHLYRGLHQESFILKDGIGRILPVQMNFVCSWESFHFALGEKFRNVQGYRMVLNKRYVIQDTSITRKDVDWSLLWEDSFLPGQKEPQTSDIYCAGCEVWYQRITKYNDVDPSPPVIGQIMSQGRGTEFGPPSSDHPDDIVGSSEREKDPVENHHIIRFKGVRIPSI